MRKNTLNNYNAPWTKRDKIIALCLGSATVLAVIFTIWAAKILFGPKKVKTKTVTEDIAVVEANYDNETSTKDEEYLEEVNTLTVKAEEKLEEEAPQIKSFEPPLKGEVILDFSNETPVYSKTMDDWRIHNGIDIKAPLGSEVYAVSDGVVESTYKDFKLGYTVVLDHGNGLKSVYSNLAGTDIMKVGKIVKQGDVVSLLGDTALYEVSSPVHLHLEMILHGSYVNPLDYFSLD